jgi:predicted nucleotidyltransferase
VADTTVKVPCLVCISYSLLDRGSRVSAQAPASIAREPWGFVCRISVADRILCVFACIAELRCHGRMVAVESTPMHRTITLDDLERALRNLDRRLREELGVRALYVFGSVARGEASLSSDVDLLVEFHGAATFARFMDLKFLLEDTLGVRVDLVTRAGLREPLKPRIESELRRVA